MLVCIVLLLIVSAATALTWLAGRRRKARTLPLDIPNGLMLVVAHPDDCVIAGGELAQEVIARGGTVQVVYGCSGAAQDEPGKAELRAQEAIAAWGHLGVAADKLHFSTRPGTKEMAGPLLNQHDSKALETTVRDLAQQLPPGSALVTHAHAETHVDHRFTRTAAIGALRATGRTDLILLETAEYNSIVSFKNDPVRAMLLLLTATPIIGRWARNWKHEPASLPGEPEKRLRLQAGEQKRLRRKVEALDRFVSENAGGGLTTVFGHADRLRQTDPATAPVGLELQYPGCLRIGHRLVDLSTLLLWVAGIICMGSALLGLQGLAITLFGPTIFGAIPSLVSGSMGLISLIRGSHSERWALDLGFVATALVSAYWASEPG